MKQYTSQVQHSMYKSEEKKQEKKEKKPLRISFLGLSFQGNGILNKVSFLHYIRNEKRGHRLLLQVQIIVTFVKNSDSFFFFNLPTCDYFRTPFHSCFQGNI